MGRMKVPEEFEYNCDVVNEKEGVGVSVKGQGYRKTKKDRYAKYAKFVSRNDEPIK